MPFVPQGKRKAGTGDEGFPLKAGGFGMGDEGMKLKPRKPKKKARGK